MAQAETQRVAAVAAEVTRLMIILNAKGIRRWDAKNVSPDFPCGPFLQPNDVQIARQETDKIPVGVPFDRRVAFARRHGRQAQPGQKAHRRDDFDPERFAQGEQIVVAGDQVFRVRDMRPLL